MSSAMAATSSGIPIRNQPVYSGNTTITTTPAEGNKLDTTRFELTELETFRRMVEDEFRDVHSIMHSVTSLAPEIDRLAAETRRTPFAHNISRVKIDDAERSDS